MRQWGSSLHHNGVSFFLARVPAGTEFYHGTSEASPINGTEWLAFEPEHAMVFARPHRGPPPRPHDDYEEENVRHGELRKREHGMDEEIPGPPQRPLPETFEDDTGYLHTYAAAKDLRLLYIDGMSAAKTAMGTLDSQDLVLFNGSIEDLPRGGWQENERARLACELAENEWEGRIDGVLRMEAGFEIILCQFERDLTPIRITQVKQEAMRDGPRGPGPKDNRKHGDHGARGPGDDPRKHSNGPGGPGRPGGPGHGPNSSRWMRAVTARYNGIGGNRVSLNFDHFVTAFSHNGELFQEDSRHPRIDNLSNEDLSAIRDEVTNMIKTHHPAEFCEDWQAITDMIVTRYAKELSYFGSGKIESLQRLQDEIDRVLSPFIDSGNRDLEAEIGRCATQFLPVQTLGEDTLTVRAVYGVAWKICSSLVEAQSRGDLGSAVRVIRDLVGYLDWATWKECRGCEANEICVVPIWPMGTVEDYESPKCRDASDPYPQGGESYWGGMHP